MIIWREPWFWVRGWGLANPHFSPHPKNPRSCAKALSQQVRNAIHSHGAAGLQRRPTWARMSVLLRIFPRDGRNVVATLMCSTPPQVTSIVHVFGSGFDTNDCFKLRVAACCPFGKTSCFSQNGRTV
jgi:hypothetical protein